jgi:hypothetical protein
MRELLMTAMDSRRDVLEDDSQQSNNENDDDDWLRAGTTRSVRGKQNSRHKTNGNRSTKQTNKRKTQIVESPFM